MQFVNNTLKEEDITMKKTIWCMTLLICFGVLTQTAFALPLPDLTSPCPIKGESEFIKGGGTTGLTTYVDWMVCNGDMTTHIDNSKFVFSEIEGSPGTYRGSITGYRNSTYYYYYQIENPLPGINTTTLSTLSLDIDPMLIVSAGYILGADIDIDLTNPSTSAVELHNITGEYEASGASLVVPSTSSFDDTSVPQNQTWSFSPEIPLGDESVILFLTCYYPPMYSQATILNGAIGYDGQLPIPTTDFPIIPEPTSLFLLLSAIGTIFFIRKRQ